ncbi:MAG TPA: type IX secretion system plug protein domain-containing protein [Bacteroidales bacterium]|nr:type IX secretion system plug protein domain-containing protein [Bacteroidales bacterium]
MPIPKIQTLAAILMTALLPILAQAQAIDEKVHHPSIRTVRMHQKGEPLSPPLIELHSGKQVTLRFDDMQGGSTTYSYKLIHCNARWEPSDLFESEYINGQLNGEIYHYESSFNTLRSYTHYWLNIPNETMKPALSGNYTLLVYKNYNPSDTVLTRRFRITEGKVRVKADIDRINRFSPDKANQEINLEIHTGRLNLQDPYNSLKIAVTKNYHGEKLLENLNPSSINGNIIAFAMNRKLAFKGGNEFHHFNTKSTDYAGENIREIRYVRNDFHFELEEDQDRTHQPYQAKRDLNGRFRIDKERVDHPGTEADYVYVYFTLKGVPFAPEGAYYVTGQFNNWKRNGQSRMKYNSSEKEYHKRILLKQGYYDYKYIFRSQKGPQPYRISGNHPQAENDYLIHIYYSDYKKGYDRLIGHTLINSSAVDY